jgi:glycosyltransferase involved in cell wall biosynthesis
MVEPTRLAILTSTLAVGGAEQLLLDLLARIDRRSFDVRLAFLQPDPGPLGREAEALGFPVATGFRTGRIDPLCPWRLWRWFRRHSVEVVLGINHLDALLYGLPAAKAAGALFVNWENETGRRYRAHDLTMATRRFFLAQADRVVAAAEGHKAHIVQIEGVPEENITVIRNGVAPARSASTLTPVEARAKLGIPPEAPVIVQVAALRPDKAHEVMLDAFATVRRTLPDAILLIAGDGPCRAKLERQAARLGLGHNCRFLGIRRDVGDVLAASDVFALSSAPLQETLSVAAIEAMFAGLPVVSTAVGSMDEIVEQGRTGFLVPPSQPEALAARLLDLLTDPLARERMGAEGMRLALARCDIKIMVATFEDLLASLARSKREKRARVTARPASAGPRLTLLVSWKEEGRWFFLEGLRQRGFNVTALCPLFSSAPRPLAKLSVWCSRFYLPLWTLFLPDRQDAVVSWNLPCATTLGLMTRLLRPFTNLSPHLARDFHIDATRVGQPLYARKLQILAEAMPGIDLAFTTSRTEEARYAKLFHCPKEKFRFLPDAPPRELFDVPPVPLADYVFAYGNSDRDFDTLLTAVAQLNVSVLLLSQNYAPAVPIPRNVTIIRDYVSRQELIRLIGAARCCVVPLRDYQVAAGQNSMFEAMALAKPLVIAHNVAIDEYVTSGRNALTYQPRDAPDLAAKILCILQDAEAAEAMGREARLSAHEWLTRQVEVFLLAFKDLQEKRGR